MASIRELRGKKRTTYNVRWRRSDGSNDGDTFDDKRTAERYRQLRDIFPDRDEPDEVRVRFGFTPNAPAPRRAGGPTVADIYRRWTATRDVERAATDDSLFRIQLAPLHDVAWSELTALDVRAWVGGLTAARREDGRKRYKARTIRDALNVFRALLSAAEDGDLVAASQAHRMRQVQAPRAAKARHHDDVLTVAELEHVLAITPRRWVAFFALMALTGCRPSDALGLTPELVAGGVARFGRMKVITRNGQRVHVGIATDDEGGKSAATWRDETLPPLAAELIWAHLVHYPAKLGQPIFRTESGALPDLANVRRIWRRVLDDAGIDRHITPYHLKHTFGTMMARAGVDAVDGAARMGQSTVTLWQETYARPTSNGDAALAKLASFAPRLFGESSSEDES